jgi:hypothetical protein
MAKLVSMANKKGKSDGCDCDTDCACSSDGGKYPYGLVLHLGDDQLKALGIKELPRVGSEILLSCKAKVTSAREEERGNGEVESYCGLQITAMGTEGTAKPMFDHPSRVREE